MSHRACCESSSPSSFISMDPAGAYPPSVSILGGNEHGSHQYVPCCAPLGHAEANMLIASRSTFMVAVVPSADRIGHSADTDQRRL